MMREKSHTLKYVQLMSDLSTERAREFKIGCQGNAKQHLARCVRHLGYIMFAQEYLSAAMTNAPDALAQVKDNAENTFDLLLGMFGAEASYVAMLKTKTENSIMELMKHPEAFGRKLFFSLRGLLDKNETKRAEGRAIIDHMSASHEEPLPDEDDVAQALRTVEDMKHKYDVRTEDLDDTVGKIEAIVTDETLQQMPETRALNMSALLQADLGRPIYSRLWKPVRAFVEVLFRCLAVMTVLGFLVMLIGIGGVVLLGNWGFSPVIALGGLLTFCTGSLRLLALIPFLPHCSKEKRLRLMEAGSNPKEICEKGFFLDSKDAESPDDVLLNSKDAESPDDAPGK
jgi:hypothetical protein